MDLWQALRIVLRRFYVFVPIAIAAVLLSSQMSGRIDPEYTVSGSALLLGPNQVVENAQPNPWGELPTTARAIALTVQSTATRADVANEGFAAPYVVSVDNRSQIFEVSATHEDPAVAAATAERVIEVIGEDLEAKQDASGVVPESRVTLDVLSMPNAPVKSDSGASRVRVLVLAVGLFAAVGAALLFDVLVSSLRSRSAARKAKQSAPVLVPQSGPPNGDGGVPREPVDAPPATSDGEVVGAGRWQASGERVNPS